MATASHDTHATFEEVYPKAPFADLVRLALWLGEGAAKLRDRLEGSGPGVSGTAQTAGR